jgi:agmatine deiminase
MDSFNSRGWMLPAEWAPQAAVWFSWPVSDHIWPGKKAAIEAKFVEIVLQASRFQKVCINATASAHEHIAAQLTAAGVDSHAFQLWDHPTNDVWCRDHGPLFMRSVANGDVQVADWEFNAWGGKYPPWDLDNKIPTRIASSLGMHCTSRQWILEGGAIESNGEGVIMTTSSVMMNPNRNWPAEREKVEEILLEGLGAQEIFWLEHGLPNDDTDGHIDNVARFFGINDVLTVADDTLPGLKENIAVLKKRFETVVTLPLPKTDGPPRSYANFLILNGAVLVPVFSQAADREALAIIGDCFPGREIVGIDCNLLLEEGGAVHCLSMQQPGLAN